MTRRALVALLLDVVAVAAFVAIGRRSHDESGRVISGAAKVAAPFLIGLAAGWLISRAWRQPTWLSAGLIIWLTTVVVGLVLRRTVFDRGTAASFIVVTTVSLAVLLLGWRFVANRILTRAQGRQTV